MSTRSAITRPTGESSFAGSYHHWDGYPSGLGATLFQIHRDVFKGDTEKMLATLIDEHPAGWSTINGADWSISPRAHDRNLDVCTECGEPSWKHYAQQYPQMGLDRPEVPDDPNGVLVLGHTCRTDHDAAKPPECYCHDTDGNPHESESDPAEMVTQDNASGSGCEWVYVIDDEKRTMTVLSSYVDGRKMIGMFGSGDPDAEWHGIAVVDLDGPEPNWEAMQS